MTNTQKTKTIKPKVSLVLVSRNEKQFAQQFVETYNKLTTKPDEVILVDSSDDKTPEILKPITNKIYTIPKSTAGDARNYGVSKSTGDIILFTDVDAVPEPDWVKEIIKPFNDPTISVVVGTAKFTTISDMVPPKTGRLYMNHCNAAYRREVFTKHLMDPRLPHDDMEFAYRVGKDYLIYGQPSAKVLHQGTFADKIWICKRTGIGWIRVWLKYRTKPIDLLFWFTRWLYNTLVILFVRHDIKMFLWASYAIFYGAWHECILKDVEQKHLI